MRFANLSTLTFLLTFGLCLGQYDYIDALSKSILFYEAQRSGDLDEATNRIDWRGDSALGDFPVGGYYDAGDHVKFGLPGAFATTLIAWGGITFKDGYIMAAQMDYLISTLKWQTDYFIACHVSEFEFIGQVGSAEPDHSYWGRPEEMTMPRPSYYVNQTHPGSEVAGETAAALAAASIVYRDYNDVSGADLALQHARELFNFADTYRGDYSDAIPDVACCYDSYSGYGDELAWAAIWLYKATNEQAYLTKALDLYNEFGLDYQSNSLGWDNKVFGVQVLLAEATLDTAITQRVQDTVNYLLYSAPRTPMGLVYLSEWGALRSITNTLLPCLQASISLGISSNEVESLTESQINYILGDTGRSYVCGFGVNPPQQPHHRGASCPDQPAECDWDEFNNPGPNYQILNGALVGGPDDSDNYVDARDDYVHNEVAIDYNSGFQGVLAYMVQRG